MREIKFRAFNKKTQKMEYYDPFFVGPSRLPPLDGWDGTRVPMQFTGLKDKNGKEIYEGDIVEYQYISTKEIGVVEYDPQSTLYGPTVCEVEEGCWSVLAEKETKVIGNVWENPDLLAANK